MLPMEHVELAVLSACETSLGADDTPGEGLIGIQRAFQVAGVKSTVASYWKVNAAATQMLMNKFYENLIADSEKAKADGKIDNSTTVRIDALRDAQLWMLRNLKPTELAQLTRGIDDETPLRDIQKSQPQKPAENISETMAHPRYWAASVLSGDWR
jgi:CHAT domain-containing protein